MTEHRPYNILFLCTGNSARSILAEAITSRIGAGKFVAYSAGSMPKGEVHPQAIKLLQSLGYDTGKFRSKPWDEFAVEGTPTEVALAFADTYRMLANRIGLFVNLPFEKLDRMSLKRRMDDIGKTSDAPQPA